MASLLMRLRNAWRSRKRRRALRERLRELDSEDYQTVRAYLTLNAGDEIFIRAFLSSSHHGLQRHR